MSNALGIDTSYYEGQIDWEAYKRENCVFGSTRATLGTGYTDPTYEPNIADMGDHGIYSSSYHYFLGKQDPKKQAQHYWDIAGQTNFPPCLDLETTSNTGMTPEVISASTYICLQEIGNRWGRKPMIYTGWDPINAIWGNPAWMAEYDLWVANYTTASKPLLPKPWSKAGKTWRIWQFTDKYEIAGTTPDGNWFNGDEAALRDWVIATGGKVPGPVELTLGQKVDILWAAHPDLWP